MYEEWCNPGNHSVVHLDGPKEGGAMMHSVKEVASMLDMTEHTVRYYTDKGLVPNLKRDHNNNRLFDEAALNWLLCVKHLRHCGMSVDDIKRYIGLCLGHVVNSFVIQ